MGFALSIDAEERAHRTVTDADLLFHRRVLRIVTQSIWKGKYFFLNNKIQHANIQQIQIAAL